MRTVSLKRLIWVGLWLTVPTAHALKVPAFIPDAPKAETYVLMGQSIRTTVSLNGVIRYQDGTHSLTEHAAGRALQVQGRELSDLQVNWYPQATAPSRLQTYESLRLDGLWPGVSGYLRVRDGVPEKVFAIAPGAAVDLLRFEMSADDLSVAHDGRLVAAVGQQHFMFSKPIAWQYVDGEKKSVPVTYTIENKTYGYQLGEYDRTQVVHIDPFLDATFLGSGFSDTAVDIDFMPGAVFITGSASLDGFTGAGSGLTGQGLYVAKLSEDLGTLMELALIEAGSGRQVVPTRMARSGDSLYVVGSTNAIGLPLATNGFAGGNSDTDGYIVRLNASDLAITSSMYVGGSNCVAGFGDVEVINAVAIAGSDVYVAGTTCTSDFPTTVGAAITDIPTGSAGIRERGFVAQLSADLSSIAAASYFGGTTLDSDAVLDVMVRDNRVAIAGSTNSSDLPAVEDGAINANSGFNNGYVALLSDDLTTVQQSTYFGPSGSDFAIERIAFMNGSYYVAGTTREDAFNSLIGGAQETLTANCSNPVVCTDILLGRINESLTLVQQATLFGGSYNEQIGDLSVRALDNEVRTIGFTESDDLPITVGALSDALGGAPEATNNAFLSVHSGDLTSLTSATYLGVNRLVSTFPPQYVDAIDKGYLAGTKRSAELPGELTGFAFQGDVDAFAISFSPANGGANNPMPDTFPDPFPFPLIEGAPLETEITSEVVEISGIDAAADINVSGGQYSVNGAPFTDVASSVLSGDMIRARLTTSAVPSDRSVATVTVGGRSEEFEVFTEGPPTLSVQTMITDEDGAFLSIVNLGEPTFLNAVVTNEGDEPATFSLRYELPQEGIDGLTPPPNFNPNNPTFDVIALEPFVLNGEVARFSSAGRIGIMPNGTEITLQAEIVSAQLPFIAGATSTTTVTVRNNADLEFDYLDRASFGTSPIREEYRFQLNNLGPGNAIGMSFRFRTTTAANNQRIQSEDIPELDGMQCSVSLVGIGFEELFCELAPDVFFRVGQSIPVVFEFERTGNISNPELAEASSMNEDPNLENNSVGFANFQPPQQDPETALEQDQDDDDPNNDGWCFIATAAYGSYLEPEVVTLRKFRDEHLLTNAPGRWFVETYYAASPSIADWIRDREWARSATRIALLPIVSAVKSPEVVLPLVGGLPLIGLLLWRSSRRRAVFVRGG